MADTTDALLPCPFCGGKACWEAGSDNQHWAGATCKACGVTLDDQDSGCMERVAAAWNTRATPAGSASGEDDALDYQMAASAEAAEVDRRGKRIAELQAEVARHKEYAADAAAAKLEAELAQRRTEAEAALAEARRDAERLMWASRAWGGWVPDFTSYVLRVGGNGDLGDVRAYIDAALHQRKENGRAG